MSQLFSTLANTFCVAANTTSGTTKVTIPMGGQFMLDNTGNVPVFIGYGFTSNTANAVIPVTGTSTKGFWVQPNQTKWFSTEQENNFTSPNSNWLVSGITLSGTANVYVSSCFAHP
jgi:hypothetical protein